MPMIYARHPSGGSLSIIESCSTGRFSQKRVGRRRQCHSPPAASHLTGSSRIFPKAIIPSTTRRGSPLYGVSDGAGGARGVAQPAVGGVLFPDASMLPGMATNLPPLEECVHFLNLTNGLEALPALQQARLPFGFCRIQSTACEQQKFEQIMNEVDANLLMHLAMGRCCLVWDYGSRNRKRSVPRAVWYGLEFIRFALNKEWLDLDTDAYLRGVRVSKDFSAHVKSFSRSTKRRIRYFKRYVPANMTEVRLYGVYKTTQHDSDVEFYRRLLHRHCLSANPMRPVLPSQRDEGNPGLREELEQLGFRLFMGGVCHQDLATLLGDQRADSRPCSTTRYNSSDDV